MLLTFDVGNTNIKTGIFDGDEMIAYVRFSTDLKKTSDEYGLILMEFLRHKCVEIKSIEAVCASSVVPSINFTIEHMCRTYFGFDPMWVGPGVRTGINIRYDNPREVGTDRICSSVAAQEMYGGPAIVIDFGTATTFNALSAAGEFLGGAIMPGIKLSTEALVQYAAKLPRIELVKPEHIINRNTVSNMQAGIVYGYVGSVDHIIRHMRRELGGKAKVIATGGMSTLIAPSSETIDILNGQLTLEGLRIIFQRNQEA